MLTRFKLLRWENEVLEGRQVSVEEGWVAMVKRFMLLDWVAYGLVCGVVFVRLKKAVGPGGRSSAWALHKRRLSSSFVHEKALFNLNALLDTGILC